MLQIDNPSALETFITSQPAAMLYFGSPGCGVCLALKPRVETLVAEEFPKLPLAEVDCAAAPELAARHQVFVVPAVLVFSEGREVLRKARRFSTVELAEELARPYALRFE